MKEEQNKFSQANFQTKATNLRPRSLREA